MTPVRALRDSGIIVWRQLIQLPRIPEVLIFALIQPVMFVLLFRYVFGGAIATPGESYVNYLMPGIFAQTVAFGAVASDNVSLGSGGNVLKNAPYALAGAHIVFNVFLFI